MNLFRAFIAGLVVPSVVLPFGLLILTGMGKEQILTSPFFHWLPIIWGIWNVIYFALIRWVLYIVDLDIRLYITGALLGLLVALAAIFWIDLPEKLGIPNYLKYFPLIAVPVLYAIVWRYLVKPLNELLDLKN